MFSEFLQQVLPSEAQCEPSALIGGVGTKRQCDFGRQPRQKSSLGTLTIIVIGMIITLLIHDYHLDKVEMIRSDGFSYICDNIWPRLYEKYTLKVIRYLLCAEYDHHHCHHLDQNHHHDHRPIIDGITVLITSSRILPNQKRWPNQFLKQKLFGGVFLSILFFCLICLTEMTSRNTFFLEVGPSPLSPSHTFRESPNWITLILSYL